MASGGMRIGEVNEKKHRPAGGSKARNEPSGRGDSRLSAGHLAPATASDLPTEVVQLLSCLLDTIYNPPLAGGSDV